MVGKPDGKIGRNRRIWENNVKWIFRKCDAGHGRINVLKKGLGKSGNEHLVTINFG
jgi:hypothetical protein